MCVSCRLASVVGSITDATVNGQRFTYVFNVLGRLERKFSDIHEWAKKSAVHWNDNNGCSSEACIWCPQYQSSANQPWHLRSGPLPLLPWAICHCCHHGWRETFKQCWCYKACELMQCHSPVTIVARPNLWNLTTVLLLLLKLTCLKSSVMPRVLINTVTVVNHQIWIWTSTFNKFDHKFQGHIESL